MHLRNPRSLAAVLFVTGVLSVLCVSADTRTDSWFFHSKESANGVFNVTLDSNSSTVSLNDFQKWLLTIKYNKTDEVVSPARIKVTGGMPMHGHGLPTQPQVTEYLGEGRYSLEGIKFNMHGQWVLEFQITTAQTVDSVVFEVIVDY